MTRKNSEGGYDPDTHHLIALHEPPESLVALRRELMFHTDITNAAQHGQTFEECLGIIAAKLDIVLDGDYDCGYLCAMLVEALRNRGNHGNRPYLRVKGLVDAEIVEKEGEVVIQARDREVTTVAPEGSIVTDVDTTGKNRGNDRS